MISGLASLTPLFLGPLWFILSTVLVILVALVVLRLLIGLAWRLVVIVAIIVAVFWLFGSLSAGPPPFA